MEESLMAKLAQRDFQLHPYLHQVMSGVGNAGLHKMASAMYGVDQMDLQTAAGYLGVRLVNARRKQAAVSAGLSALKRLEDNGDVKLAFAPMPTSLMKNTGKALLGGADDAARAATMPTKMGGSLNKGSSGMFSAFDDAAGAAINPKSTLRGTTRGALPDIRPLPTGA